MIRMIVHQMLVISLIVFLNVSAAEGKQIPIEPSPVLYALIQQADNTYVRPYGNTIDQLVNQDVNALAVMLGFAMQGQKMNVERNRQYLQRFDSLRTEAHDFLESVARAHNFRNPRDGKPIGRQSLGENFDRAMMGHLNNWAVQNRFANPATVRQPMILALAPTTTKTPDEPNEGLPVSDGRSVDLLGVEASELKRPPKDWSRYTRKPFPEDAIVGTWTMINKEGQKRTTTIQKRGNSYTGKTRWNWREWNSMFRRWDTGYTICECSVRHSRLLKSDKNPATGLYSLYNRKYEVTEQCKGERYAGGNKNKREPLKLFPNNWTFDLEWNPKRNSMCYQYGDGYDYFCR